MDEPTNKENALAQALSQIEALGKDKTQLMRDLETAKISLKETQEKFAALQTEHTQVKAAFEALEAKHRDMDAEVAQKVAQVAAQSGVAPVESAPTVQEESLEDLAKRIDAAQGMEKARLIEDNYNRLITALKGVSR